MIGVAPPLLGGVDELPARTPLDELPAELLALVAGALELDDELAASLACCKLHHAVMQTQARDGRAFMMTAASSALASVRKLEWAWSCGLPLPAQLCLRAAKNGQLAQLGWLRAHGAPFDESTCTAAAIGGQVEVLQYLRTSGCPWDTDTPARAAQGGHLSVLQWVHTNGCPWDRNTPAQAAGGGHLEVLQWARANGCLWTRSTSTAAARGGQLEVLKYLRANGCPWDKNIYFDAASCGHLAVLQWANASECFNKAWTLYLTIERTRAEWNLGLLERKALPEQGSRSQVRTQHDFEAVVEWLRANGCSLL